MLFFGIMCGDGLMVEVLECYLEGFGFKPYLEHSSSKKIPSLGIQRPMTLVDMMCQLA